MKLKVMTVGSSIGIILPEEALTRLKVANGDFVFLTESQDGYLITAFDLGFEEQMALARTFMRERRQALQELAQ